MYISHFAYLFCQRTLALLLCFSYCENVAMNIAVSCQDPACGSFRYIIRSRIAGPYGSSVFKFLKNRHTVYHNGCIILHSHNSAQDTWKYTVQRSFLLAPRILLLPHTWPFSCTVCCFWHTNKKSDNHINFLLTFHHICQDFIFISASSALAQELLLLTWISSMTPYRSPTFRFSFL